MAALYNTREPVYSVYTLHARIHAYDNTDAPRSYSYTIYGLASTEPAL